MTSPYPFGESQHALEGGILPATEAPATLTREELIMIGEDPGDEESMPVESSHDDNLAEDMSDADLSRIAADIEEWVRIDIESRKEWHDKLADGTKLIGVVNDRDTDPKSQDAFKLVKNVSHPLIAEACVQFQARAIAELVPPGGPVKTTVLGEKTEEREEQAARVADYMNYSLMVENTDYYPETDAMLFMLALEGSQFKKTFHDPLTGMNVSQHIRPEDFIVPYGARSLKSAPRYTHQISISRNDMKKLQANGAYRKVDLMTPSEGGEYNDRIKEVRDRAQGQEESVMRDDIEHTVWECVCDYSVPGHEDPDGIDLPYIISVDKESRTVLSIRRNWEESDEKKVKIESAVHYPFIPADGFYSYGFLHLIGGLGKAASGLLKTILMGAAYASIPGGFKSKDCKIPGNVDMEFGKWTDTQMSADELKNAFFQPAVKEPGPALFQILNVIIESSQRFSSTTENMVGDANNNGPVGTTVALIEQGSKVFSGNHKRLHYAQGQEFQQLARLHGKYLPEEGYPYQVPGGDQQIFRKDFDDRIDVVPVSDPNIFSSTQRIAIAQSVRQMAMEQPALFNQRKVTKRMLEAMRVPDADDILLDPEDIKRRDPVSENMCMMVGIPTKAFQDQDHDAHYAVCMTEIQRIEAEKNPAMMQLLPAFYSHLAQHTAYAMRLRYSQAMGLPLPPIDLNEEAEGNGEDIDPMIDSQIAMAAAQAIAKMPKPPAEGSPEMQQQQEQMQQQAQQIEQAAKVLNDQKVEMDKERQQIEQAKVELDKMKADLKAQQREAGLQADIEKLQIDNARLKDDAIKAQHDIKTQGIMDTAVGNVKDALDKKTQADMSDRHKQELADAKKGGNVATKKER